MPREHAPRHLRFALFPGAGGPGGLLAFGSAAMIFNALFAKIFGVALVVISIATWGLWTDNQAKARHISDLELAARNSAAVTSALTTLTTSTRRLDSRFQHAIQGLRPDALSQACLTDPALLAAYAATRSLRADFEADAASGHPASGLPNAGHNRQPRH